MNASAVFLHLLDFYAGLNGGKGVVLDFVGQCESGPSMLVFWSHGSPVICALSQGVLYCVLTAAYPASLSRILILDFLMFLLQLTSLVVSYTTNHGTNIPKSPLFPYDDILLPPSPAETIFHAKLTDDEEPDLESGGLRRRRGPGAGRGGYGVAEEIWLDDDDDEDREVADAEGTSPRASVFSLDRKAWS